MNSNLFKKIFTLVMGLGAAQLVLILATPLLTRLYTPQAFAYFGYLVSLIMVVLPLASLQYEYAIPLVKIKKMVPLLTKLCLYLVLLNAFVILGIFFIIKPQYPLLNINNEMVFTCFLILIMQGILQIYTMQMVAQDNTAAVGYGKLIQNSSMVAVQVFLPLFFSPSATILLVGLLFGLFFNLLYFKFLIIPLASHSNTQLTKRRLFFFLKKHSQLPLYSSWAQFIESASTLMPVFLIGPLYGANAVGVYFLVYRVFSAPSGLLSTAISKVMLKEMADRVKANVEIKPLFLKLSFYLTNIAIVYLIVMLAISPYATLIFGHKWSEVEVVLKILAPIIALTLCVSPLSSIYILLNKNRMDSLWQVSYLALTIGIMCSYRYDTFTTMLINLVIVWVALYSIYWFMMLKIIYERDRKLCAV